jgi:serine/threonine protein kinase
MTAVGPTARFYELEGVTFDLSDICEQLRHGIEVRNRSSMKRLHKCSFVGTTAVGFLVSSGIVPNRSKAVSLGRILQEKGYIRHVTDQSKFKDAQVYFRFYKDEDANHASLDEVSLGTWGQPGVSAEGKTWGFAPHTAHNSLVLDFKFAEFLEAELHAPSVSRRAAALEQLRTRVREQVRPDCPGWEAQKPISRTDARGQFVRTKVWGRTRPRGNFTNLKTEGAIGVSPKEFMENFLDLNKRHQMDGEGGAKTDGTIVEALYTPPVTQKDSDEGNSSLLGLLSPALPKPPPNRETIAAAAAESNPNPNTEGGYGVAAPEEPEPKSSDTPAFTSLRPPQAWGAVDLSSCPENMSIANLGRDVKLEETLSHLGGRMNEAGNVEECMLCTKPFDKTDTRDLHDCPSCGSICCSFCCSKRVFEVNLQNELRVCIHCYQESSRIKHPVGTLAYASSKNKGHMDFLSMSEIRQALEDEANMEANAVDEAVAATGGEERPSGVESDEEEDELTEAPPPPPPIPITEPKKPALKSAIVAVEPPIQEEPLEEEEPEVEEMPKAVGFGAPPVQKKAIGFAPPPVDAKPKKKKASGGVRFTPSVDGGEGGTGAVAAKIAASKEVNKWATCKQCGARVKRTLEAIELHDETCEATQVASTTRTISAATPKQSTWGGGLFKGSSNKGSSGGGGLSASAHGFLSSLGGSSHGNSESEGGGRFLLGGVGRVVPESALPEKQLNALLKSTCRIVFRTREGDPTVTSPRQVCALQDSFMDADTGLCCVYEISVRHRRVAAESPDHVTAEVLFMAHAARPHPTHPEKGALLTVVSQVDAKSKSKWLSSVFGQENNYCQMGGLDVLNELASAEAEAVVLQENEGGGQVSEEDTQHKVTLADFDLMTVLGRGGFGKVMQVKHKETGKIYAMKIFKKNELRKRRQVERTKTERDILCSVRHPYIVQLSYAFQNATKLYMVMDFVQGGDFFTFMRKFGKLRESWVQLYICEIALALQHLHELDVVYRDLKPENVLMDGTGHVKLTDFGLSRSFDGRPALPEDLPAALNDAAAGETKPGEPAPTNLISRSYCGTEQYMAPEMLLQRGHGRVVDWWCLGLLMHEMLTGRHPFQQAAHYDTLRAMVTSEPMIDPRVSPTARALIRRLLIKDPRRRLGAQRGAWIELRPHPFFNGLEWDKVVKREVAAPYVPVVSGETGTENFEDVFTREKPIDSVVETPSNKKGLFGGMFGSKGKYVEEEDKDFEGFSYHGDQKSILDE